MLCEQIIAYHISTARIFSLIYFLLNDQFPVPATRGHLTYPCTPPGVPSPRIIPLSSTHPQRESSLQALATVQYVRSTRSLQSMRSTVHGLSSDEEVMRHIKSTKIKNPKRNRPRPNICRILDQIDEWIFLSKALLARCVVMIDYQPLLVLMMIHFTIIRCLTPSTLILIV